ncbi:MAG: hypothetical protein IKM20_10725 [Erysipelotrichales bacterium]|nr:hypothetical protein [Erysipelotrichales bacterium]
MLIGVVISDRRQAIIADVLEEYHLPVIRILSNEDLDYNMDILVLPIRGINENCILQINNTVLNFSSFFKYAKKELIIYSGVACKYLEQLPFKLIKLLSNEDIIDYNSKLTAQGLLIDLLMNIDISIDEVSIDIIGFGHSGKAIYKMFSKLCPNIRIVSSQKLSKFGDFPVNIIDYDTYRNLNEYSNVIINTAPTMILDSFIIDKLKDNNIILDIASAPGGTDFDYAFRKGIKALLLPALPAKYVGYSAGKILGNQIVKDVENNV